MNNGGRFVVIQVAGVFGEGCKHGFIASHIVTVENYVFTVYALSTSIVKEYASEVGVLSLVISVKIILVFRIVALVFKDGVVDDGFVNLNPAYDFLVDFLKSVPVFGFARNCHGVAVIVNYGGNLVVGSVVDILNFFHIRGVNIRLNNKEIKQKSGAYKKGSYCNENNYLEYNVLYAVALVGDEAHEECPCAHLFLFLRGFFRSFLRSAVNSFFRCYLFEFIGFFFWNFLCFIGSCIFFGFF